MTLAFLWANLIFAVLALVVLLMAGAIAHRTMRALGIGRHGAPGSA